MSLATQRLNNPKNAKMTLVKTVLASSVLLSSMAYMNVAYAVTTPVVANINAAGNSDYEFTADVTLTVPDTENITETGGASVKTNMANTGTVQFDGTTKVLGDIGVNGALEVKELIFQGAAGKTVTITGAVEATTLTFGNGGTVIFNGIVGAATPSILNATGDGTATFNAAATLGATTLGGGGADTFNATFGTTLDVNGANDLSMQGAAQLKVTGAATVGRDLNLTDNSIATFNNTLSVTRDIGMLLNSQLTVTGAATITGDLTLQDNAVATFNGVGSTTGVSVGINDNAVVNFNANHAITVDLDLGQVSGLGAASVRTGATVTSANINTAAGSRLIFDLGNTATAGKFVAANNANITGVEVVHIINPGLTAFALGTSAPVSIINGAGGVLAIPTLNAPNNLFLSFALTQAVTDINLVATRTMPTGLSSNISGLATMIGTNATGAEPGAMGVLNTQILAFTDTGAQEEALASVAPLIDGGIIGTVLTMQDNTFDLFSQRLGQLQAGLGDYNTGYAAGHMNETGHGTWVKIFGNHADQNKRDNIKGYKSDTWGIAAGGDLRITERHIVGLAFTWASTDVKHALNGGNTDVNTYQGSVYGSWNMRSPLYVNWMASAAKNDYDSTRTTIVNNFKQTTIAEFDGWQYGARAELGYVFGQELSDNHVEITPTVSLTYSHVDFDRYVEKGQSTANQIVEYKDVNTMLAGVGVQVAYDYQMEKSLVVPEVHLNASYDIFGDRQKADAQFVQFGPQYETAGASAVRMGYNAGLSLTTYGKSGLGLGVSYDLDWKRSYHAHSGFVRVRYEW